MSLAQILLASRGLTGEGDPTRIIAGDLARAENVGYSAGNLLEKEPGTSRITATALAGAPRIVAGWDWWPTALIQRRVIATSDGKLLKDSMTGAFGTTLKTGLTANRVVHMSEGGEESTGRAKKLFVCTGVDPVQVLAADGLTTADLAQPPLDWSGTNQPSFMFMFRGFNIGGGNANAPHRLYASLGADHEDLLSSGAFTLNVYPGEGQGLVAGLTALGRAWLFKSEGCYWINDAASDVAEWYAQPASRQYGAARTPHAVSQIDEATIAFLSNTGAVIFMQETSGSLVGVSFTDLFRVLRLRDLVKNELNAARLDRSQVRWYDDKKQLHVTYAASGSAQQGRRLVVDFNSERTRVELSSKETCESLWMEADAERIGRPVAGDHVGILRRLDQEARTVDGAPYTMRVATTPTDLSDINASFAGYKLFYRLHLEYEATGDYDLPVTITIDGKERGTVLFNMGSGAGAVLPFTLPATLGAGGAELRRRSRDIAGEGYYVSLGIAEGTANNPRIARAWLEFDALPMNR